jgi:type VI secretion system secreted protein VgrG
MSLLQLFLACGEPLSVHRFSVREALSSLFSVSIVARSPEPSLDFDAIVGRPAALRIVTGYGFARDGGGRRWAGVCRRIEQVHALETAPSEAGLSTYALQLVPELWLLTQRRNFRVFQHLSIPEIAGQLLQEWSIDPLWQLGDSTPRLEYRVQYGESDYDFFCRLL